MAWPLIQATYETEAGQTISDKPCRSYQQDCVRRADVLADLQAAIAFVESKVLSGIHDATTKQGKHLGCVQVRVQQWYHIGPLGKCDGECVTLRQAKSAGYYHISQICRPRH